MKIKSPSVAGTFYPGSKEELISQLNTFEQNNSHDYEYQTRVIIVPHAGYVYSGQLASSAFQYLDKSVKNVFIFAPPHRVPVRDIALSSFDKWATPLGEIKINTRVNEELVNEFGFEFYDEAFSQEHSAEVQVPFIQKYLTDVKIIPILVGNIESVEKIITRYYGDSENAFVISSDLSHFYKSNEAKRIDLKTAEMIEEFDTEKFEHERACGAVGILGLINFIQNSDNKYSLIRVGMYNSGDVTGDESRVVGYGSWFLYEGARNEFIKKYFSEFVIDVCKKSILAGLEKENVKLDRIPPVFGQLGACFVTLEKNGDLRGCIGSIIAHRWLIDDLAQNAQNSAFSDPRFQPLKKHEFDELEIDVSLLSTPEKMSFKDEQDLLNQIKPFLDGIIIKDKGYQSVYLPSVWEQLPEKEMFLKSLKIKAGMTPEHFSSTFEAYRYTTEYIKG